jgi:uncharacterized protein YraI
MCRATALLVVCLLAVAALGETGRARTDLNVRTAPSPRHSSVIAVLTATETFQILKTTRGWYQIRVERTGVEGWVAKKYVESVPDAPRPEAVEAGDTPEGGGMATVVVIGLIVVLLAAIGYAAGHQSPKAANGAKPNPIPAFIASVAIGTFYVGLTLPKALITVGKAHEWLTVAGLGERSLAFNQRLSAGLPGFPTLMRFVLWAVLAYLGSLLLLAVRHGKLDLFGWGSVTLALSIAIFHLIAWGGYIAAKIAMLVMWIFGTIGGFVAWLFGTIFGFIGKLVLLLTMGIYHLLVQMLGGLWWLVPAILTIAVAGLLFRSQGDAREILKTIARVVLFVAAGGAVFLLLRWLWQWIGDWVIAAFEAVASFLIFVGTLFLRLLAGLAVLVAVATIGQLLLDQIQGALSAGRRRRGVIIGAIAIGSSIAILLFVSNIYGVCTWLPSPVTEFATKYLHQPAPLLDALIAIGIVSLSVVGIWRNVPALGEEPTMREFGKSLVYSILGVLLAGALVGVAGQTEN